MTVADEARTLLVVDDDTPLRTRLARAFRDRGFQVREAQDGPSALRLAREESPELAVVDLRMPDSDGLDVVRGLKQIDATTNVVVLTGYGSIATALEAVRLGATHYLTKPADVEDLLAAFARADAPGVAVPRNEIQPEWNAPTLARVEWEHIQRVLTDAGGNVSEAARRLGIHRRSLQRKRKVPRTALRRRCVRVRRARRPGRRRRRRPPRGPRRSALAPLTSRLETEFSF